MSTLRENLTKEELEKMNKLSKELEKKENAELVEERAKAIASIDKKFPKKHKGICKPLFLTLGIIGAFAIGAFVGTHSSAPQFSINGKNTTSRQILNTMSEDSSQELMKSYRNILVSDSLKSEYGSADLKDKAKKQVAELKKQYGDTDFKNLLKVSGYQTEDMLVETISNNLMTEKYVEHKLQDKELKKEFKSWTGNIPVKVAKYPTREAAQAALNVYNTSKPENGKDKSSSSKLTLEDKKINNIESNLTSDEIKKIQALKESEGVIIETNLDDTKDKDGWTLFVKGKDPKIGSFDDAKPQIKKALDNTFRTEEGLLKSWAKDHKLESKSEFGDKLIKSFK